MAGRITNGDREKSVTCSLGIIGRVAILGKRTRPEPSETRRPLTVTTVTARPGEPRGCEESTTNRVLHGAEKSVKPAQRRLRLRTRQEGAMSEFKVSAMEKLTDQQVRFAPPGVRQQQLERARTL